MLHFLKYHFYDKPLNTKPYIMATRFLDRIKVPSTSSNLMEIMYRQEPSFLHGDDQERLDMWRAVYQIPHLKLSKWSRLRLWWQRHFH